MLKWDYLEWDSFRWNAQKAAFLTCMMLAALHMGIRHSRYYTEHVWDSFGKKDAAEHELSEGHYLAGEKLYKMLLASDGVLSEERMAKDAGEAGWRGTEKEVIDENLAGKKIADRESLERVNAISDDSLSGERMADRESLERVNAVSDDSLVGERLVDRENQERANLVSDDSLAGKKAADRESLQWVNASNDDNLTGEKLSNEAASDREDMARSDNIIRDNTTSLSAGDYHILQRIVQAEAGNCDLTGRILVANVVMNRVQSGQFPNNVKDVVYQKSQFSPVSNGSIDRCTVSPQTTEAVDRALAGEDYSKGALYFMNRAAARKGAVSWFDRKLTYLFQHGGHEFYK